MGGRVWDRDEERVFWNEMIPKSPKRLGIDTTAPQHSWDELADEMKLRFPPPRRREYTGLGLFEHWFQNVEKGRVSPNGHVFVNRYSRRREELGIPKTQTGFGPKGQRSKGPKKSKVVARAAASAAGASAAASGSQVITGSHVAGGFQQPYIANAYHNVYGNPYDNGGYGCAHPAANNAMCYLSAQYGSGPGQANGYGAPSTRTPVNAYRSTNFHADAHADADAVDSLMSMRGALPRDVRDDQRQYPPSGRGSDATRAAIPSGNMSSNASPATSFGSTHGQPSFSPADPLHQNSASGQEWNAPSGQDGHYNTEPNHRSSTTSTESTRGHGAFSARSENGIPGQGSYGRNAHYGNGYQYPTQVHGMRQHRGAEPPYGNHLPSQWQTNSQILYNRARSTGSNSYGQNGNVASRRYPSPALGSGTAQQRHGSSQAAIHQPIPYRPALSSERSHGIQPPAGRAADAADEDDEDSLFVGPPIADMGY